MFRETEAVCKRFAPDRYAVEYRSGEREVHGVEPPLFTISVADESQFQQLLTGNAYSVAMRFIRGEIDISGDLVEALRLRQNSARHEHSGWYWPLAASLARLETWFQSRLRSARNIRFHSDVSNSFYRQFLDSRMVYSAGLFQYAFWSLDDAQEARLRQICRDLELRPAEKLLDIGCGWGGLLAYAAEQCQARGAGCTLSRAQREFAEELIRRRGLGHRVTVEECDYRDIHGQFDKISSIGMFEHVGRHRLAKYFGKVYSLLKPGGLFLNSGIVRPESVRDDLETCFLLHRVFPGGEVAHLSQVIRAAESAGFGIVKIESQRLDYARTCEEWVARLRRNERACVECAGQKTYRTWLLYLAASAIDFESGNTDVFSILMSRN